MEIRALKQADRNTLGRMLHLAFGGSEDWRRSYFDPEKNPRLDPEQVLVVTEEGEIRASTTVLAMEVFVDGRAVPMGGVAAVMTDPAYRRRGYAKELLKENLRDMRRRGTHLSMLDPFSHQFYRNSGWEIAFDHILYKLSPAKLPTSDEQRHVRSYREGDGEAVRKILDREAALHQICVRRGEGRWSQVYSRGDDYTRDREITVFDAGDGIEGYVMYRIESRDATGENEPSRTLGAELVASSLRAREGLTSFLAAFNPKDFEVQMWTPRGEPLHPYLKDSYVKTEIHPGLMLRIVDVEGALGRLKREIPEPLTLEIADDIVPENSGEFIVGDGEVRRSPSAKHRVRLDVRQLSQLYSGYLPARQLAERGLIEPDSPETLELLGTYFPVGEPWVYPVDQF